MKLYKIIFILIVFLKTETLLSENNLFNVNNIEIEKKDKFSNNELANKAIKKGFNSLLSKILLNEDINKLSNLNFSSIKQLVTYYQVSNLSNDKTKGQIANFSVTFDKDKIHNLFYEKGISYSEIDDKELYTLPILIKKNEIFIFNNNFFYDNWINTDRNDLIEFILPLEKIEIIQNINNNKNNLLDIDIKELFREYSNKNLSIILIEDNNTKSKKLYIIALIQGKKISKSLTVNNEKLNTNQFNKKIIDTTKKELINMVKSRNLIDIRTPAFLNAKLDLNKKSNFAKLQQRIKILSQLKIFTFKNLTEII